MRHPTTRQLGLLIAFVLPILAWAAAGRGHIAARPLLPIESDSRPLVVRIYYDRIDDLAALQSYDVWEYNNLRERYVLAAVNQTGYEALIEQGWTVTIDPDQQRAIDRAPSQSADYYGDYRTTAEIYADLAAINSTSSQLTELVTYGQSYCRTVGGCQTPGGDSSSGFPLLALRITNEGTPGSSVIDGDSIIRGTKPIFFLMANIHAREITTPEIAMRFIAHLIDGYNVDADTTWLVDHREIWVIPTTNPDGHQIVELGLKDSYGRYPFYQRKNANNDANRDSEPDCSIWPPSSYEQFGIDLNRNHSFDWGPPGSSDQPCDMTYRGPSKASESEVHSLENLVRTLIPDQRAADLNAPAPKDTVGLLITLHSFSNLVLWPWGSTTLPAPNKIDLKAIGDKFAGFNGYLSCQPTHCLYGTNGATDDWAYGELGIPAFTFEIGNQFMPAYAEIDAVQWPDNRPALIYAAKIARTPYMTVHGPDALELTVATDIPGPTLHAIIDDRFNGGEPVSAAIYSIDIPPDSGGANLRSLEATDGAFDSITEAVSGRIDLTDTGPGRHILFVRGQDINRNWGAISAIFIDVAASVADTVLFPAVISP